MKRIELFKILKKEWKEKNESFFGIPVENDTFIPDEVYKEYSDKYWNNEKTRCTVCRHLFNNLDKNNMDDFIPYKEGDNESGFFIGYSADYNVVYGWFYYDGSKKRSLPVFLIPRIFPNLEWKSGKAEYIPRSVIERNITTLGKIDGIVRMPGRFSYNCNTGYLNVFKDKTFDSTGYEGASLKYLKAFCPEFVEGEDEETFKKHLEQLPDTKFNNLINYHFYDFNYFFDKVLKEIVKVNPTIKKPCNICSILTKVGRKKSKNGSIGKMREEEGDCTLILNSERSDIYAMSNFRSALYCPNGYSQKFFFSNTEIFFDAFKTATSKNAGKIRTLLDDVFIGEDNLLYKKLPDGRVLNQFEAYKAFFIDHDQSVKTESLSCLSKTMYCSNNDPKRIMMTAKGIGQSIPMRDDIEYDKATHSVLARVVFGDFFGLTNGDGLVISESFAKKMVSYRDEKIFIPKNDPNYEVIMDIYKDKIENGVTRYLTVDQFVSIINYKKNNFNRCFDITVIDVREVNKNYGPQKNRKGINVLIRYYLPVKTGDKFTNQHGSKGVITAIVPDDQMPKLTEKCGVMEPGPFDLIISSFGITKRANIGQICEAYSRMKGIEEEMPLEELFKDSERYSRPLVEFNGKVTEKCFGIQEILRLQHLSISHASFSGIDKVTNYMLNFGEQENLFLLAHDMKNAQQEINQRSPKYFRREENINNIILNKELKEKDDLTFNMELLGVFYSLGFNVQIKDANDEAMLELIEQFENSKYVNNDPEDKSDYEDIYDEDYEIDEDDESFESNDPDDYEDNYEDYDNESDDFDEEEEYDLD